MAVFQIVGHTALTSGILTARDVDFIAMNRGCQWVPFSADVVLQAGDEYVTYSHIVIAY